jgi:signal peptidase II
MNQQLRSSIKSGIAKIGTRLVLVIAIGATIGCDRVTKQVAEAKLTAMSRQSFFGDTIRLEYVENTGAFLGLGADWSPALRVALFGIGNGLLLLLMSVLAIRLGPLRTGIFNVADVAIMLGVGLVIIASYHADGDTRTENST